MSKLTITQINYLARLDKENDLIPAEIMFTRLRMSKLSIGRMADAGVIIKVMVNGRSHYSVTCAGINVLTQSGFGRDVV